MADEGSTKPRRRRGKQAGTEGSKKVLISLKDDDNGWWDVAAQTPGRNDVMGTVGTDTALVQKYRQRADELYDLEVSAFEASNEMSDQKWMDDTIRKGTLQDRIAAMAVLCNEHPLHKLKVMDQLLNLAGKERRVATMSGEALQNLFVDVYLPPDRKLIPLSQRPLNEYERMSSGGGAKNTKSNNASIKTLSPRVLLLWRFEELVKERYNHFLSLISVWMNDALDMHKSFALRTTIDLLSDRAESEVQLLSMAVNKIGDPAKKVAAAAGHQLRRLLEQHPAMTDIIAREVQQLAHRPHLSPKALYNCVVFLNQLKLTPSNEANSLPASLIRTYFRLFEVAIKGDASDGKRSGKKKKSNGSNGTDSAGKIRGRLLSALLTGVNRAHPYLPKSDDAMIEHIDALYRISHSAPPAAATQALMLLYQLAIGDEAQALDKDGLSAKKPNDLLTSRRNRFYRALYSKLGDSMMLQGRQMTMFFNLLFRAMKHDMEDTRVLVFSKRLLQTASHAPPGVAAGSLFLISEVMKVNSNLRDCEVQNLLTEFDPTKREPQAALGESKSGSLWESSLLACHFHPSVAKFGSSLGSIQYSGDPCKDFSLAPFLDRFAYRNPKSKERLKKQNKLGESIAERKSGLKSVNAASQAPVNDPSFLHKDAISEMDEFYHKFFVERTKRDEIKGIVRGPTKSEPDEVDYGSDSDPEEAAFAHGIAEKLMESAGSGKANYDNEDPDMEGWSDMDSNSDSDEGQGEPEGIDYSAMDGLGGKAGEDDDIVMDDDVDSSANEEEELSAEANEVANFEGGGETSDEDDDELLSSFAGGEDNGDDDEDEDTQKKKKKVKLNEGFEDASMYEELIYQSWADRDARNKQKQEERVEEDDISDKPEKKTKNKGKKKKRKGRS